MFLHAGLERAEIVDLGPEHQVGQLSIGQEDDEEHNGKAHQVLGAARHGVGQLTHGLIKVDEFKQLKGFEISALVSVYLFGQWRESKPENIRTLTQEKNTMTAAMWLNWTCRLASASKLG